MDPWFLIGSFFLGSLSALIGVMVGAYSVFRTKRDPYEPFFSAGAKGQAFNIDDDFAQVEDAPVNLSPATEAANESFIRQFAEGLADKAGR